MVTKEIVLRFYEHGMTVSAPVPSGLLSEFTLLAQRRGYTQMDVAIAAALGGDVLVFVSHASGKAWRAEIEAKIANYPPIDRWCCGLDQGASAWSIVTALTGRRGGHGDLPRDAEDFGRCVRLLDAVPVFQEQFREVVKRRYPKWGPLIDQWDWIEAAHRTGDMAGVNTILDAVFARVRELRRVAAALEDQA